MAEMHCDFARQNYLQKMLMVIMVMKAKLFLIQDDGDDKDGRYEDENCENTSRSATSLP